MAGAGATGSHTRVPGIERLSTNDLAILASDCGAAPFNIAALLVIDRGSEVPFTDVRDALAARLPQVPRLRQRLRALPVGLGRPIWVDDETFDITVHAREVARHSGVKTSESWDSGSAGGEHPDRDEKQVLLNLAADLVCEPLPRDRPLWRAHWISGLPDERAALLIVVHHVVADGFGGLAALAALADRPVSGSWESHEHRGEGRGAPAAGDADPVRPFPAPAPSRGDLVKECWRSRTRALRRTRTTLSATRSGLRELDLTEHRPRLITLTSLNRPTGPRRAVGVATVPLRAVVDTAHATGATVNDVVLTAIGGAFDAALARRGEEAPELVVSVPISARSGSVDGHRGNETGVRPIRIPTRGDARDRLVAVARRSAATAARTEGSRATSATPLLAVFRGLAHARLLRWFINHQRLIHTFVTNVRGPTEPLSLLGHPVQEIVPIAVSTGNVGITFDVLSYAGQLTVTVVADPAIVPDCEQVAADVQTQLGTLTAGRA
jgi:WS/DGAT/MGAT family acyltransferase